jgi:hypothetical protein
MGGWYSDEPDLQVGLTVCPLLTRPKETTLRIVEALTFEGERRQRRRISVDFELDPQATVQRPGSNGGTHVVPLVLVSYYASGTEGDHD